MRKLPLVVIAIVLAMTATAVAWAVQKFNNAQPVDFDPGKTHMVNSGWVDGTGCPASLDYIAVDGTHKTYANPACSAPVDKHNDGLLMAKSGPSDQLAAALVVLKDVKGINNITELGYDIRKPSAVVTDPRGSQCGATSPAFLFIATDGTKIRINCDSATSPSTPADLADLTQVNDGWVKLRWTGAALAPLAGKTLAAGFLLFDSGPTGPPPGQAQPSNFGVAILDNVDINGQFVGDGPPPNDSGGHAHFGDDD